MKKNFFLHSLPFRLLVGVAFGICIGLLLNIIDESAITTAVLNVVVTSKYILGQLISFSVPLIIIGFIAPSITKLGNNASRMLGVAVSIAYASSLGAALFSALSGYLLIPHLSFSSTASHLKALPDVVFVAFHSTDNACHECTCTGHYAGTCICMDKSQPDFFFS